MVVGGGGEEALWPPALGLACAKTRLARSGRNAIEGAAICDARAEAGTPDSRRSNRRSDSQELTRSSSAGAALDPGLIKLIGVPL